MIRFGGVIVFAFVFLAAWGDGSSTADLSAQMRRLMSQLEERSEEALAACPPEQRREVAANFDRVKRQLRFLEKGVFSRDGGIYREFLRDVRIFLNSPAKVLLTDDEKKALNDVVVWMKKERSLAPEKRGRDVPQVLRCIFAQEEDVQHIAFDVLEKLGALLRPGDVIARRGNGLWSAWFAKLSHDEKRFSHVGVVVQSRGGAMQLVHAGGDDFSGGGSRICTVSLDEFLEESVDVALYRVPNLGDRVARAAEKRIGTPFDPAFDLKTKDRLYCTEMVRDCVNEAAGREVIGTSRKGDFEYVAVDDCYRNEMTKVWDCRDQKPKEKQPIQKLQSRPVTTETPSTTNAPVRRTIRFIPKNR